MPYQLVPNAGESLLDTRDVIRENFNIITTAQSVNHFVYGHADQGKHKFLQMPEQLSAPATGVNEGGVYTKVSNTTTRLFFRDEGSGSEVQLNPSALVSFPAFGQAIGDVVPQYSYNIMPITGVKKTAVGKYTITFKNNLASAFYIVNLGLIDNAGSGNADNHIGKIITGSRTDSSFQIEIVRPGNTNPEDPGTIMISVWGG